jgi:hypothetical protein
MALKDIWTNKTDGVNDILADDINAIANEVISNTENKANKGDVLTRVETYMAINDVIEMAQELDRRKANKADTYTKAEVDTQIGDISTALDELHNYAQSLVGGES